MISRKNQVMVFYLLLIIAGAVVARQLKRPTNNDLNNMLAGAGVGLLLSVILWFVVGKSWVNK